jgi:hypothetical protein
VLLVRQAGADVTSEGRVRSPQVFYVYRERGSYSTPWSVRLNHGLYWHGFRFQWRARLHAWRKNRQMEARHG